MAIKILIEGLLLALFCAVGIRNGAVNMMVRLMKEEA